jgi:hypothetical protein
MAIDVDRIIRAVAEAVLDDDNDSGRKRGKGSGGQKRRFLSGPRAMLIGAGVVTAGRLAARLRGGDLVGRLQERLADVAGLDEDGSVDEPEDFDDEEFDDEEPYDEADEDFDEDAEDEEPEDEDDEARSASSSASSR